MITNTIGSLMCRHLGYFPRWLDRRKLEENQGAFLQIACLGVFSTFDP
jgi:Rieske Fe-S protein